MRFSLFELKALGAGAEVISLWLSLLELKRTVGFLPSIVLYLRVRADRLFPNSRHCGSAKPAGAVAFKIMVTKHLTVGNRVHFANFHNWISGFDKKRRRFFIQIMGCKWNSPHQDILYFMDTRLYVREEHIKLCQKWPNFGSKLSVFVVQDHGIIVCVVPLW